MGLFYAYFRNVNDDYSYRYVAVFATREVADEWWRAVSESSNVQFANSVKRLTPHLYTHNPNVYVVYTSLTTAGVATNFLGRVFFTLLPNRDVYTGFVPIPSPEITDHVSGNIFFIRSKANPEEYWYCPPSHSGLVASGTPVYASTTNRTRFRVTRIPGSGSTPANSIIIGTDKVSVELAASADLSVTTRQTPTGVSQVIVGTAGTMIFSDLKRSFRAGTGIIAPCSCGGGPNDTGPCTCGSGTIVRDLFKTNDGEDWELFN
ncbi:hypothetical protein BJ138DRAFT_1117914 [Hygrophoropsis aurantiaca]|uniref:Uncharacterized protein n=1 Tax=Hygrophoropsis aurantiaca TaxID=72124 RepID=A0ACB7ZXT6_9AGAM|nr:hypothetical protein BJ138DRAFT_1117914 [Hygrophoropsis aurantiaca]